MSKETREHLSSLVDGEISRETSRFLVRRLGADGELRATWTRYHLVRDCLRHQDGGIAGTDLCSRVSRVLENEAPVKPARKWSGGWLRPAAGVAVAASVALMAVVAVGPARQISPQDVGELAEEAASQPFTSPQSLTPAPYSSQASLNGESNRNNRKMDSYLLRHYQATGATGGKGFVAFIPIVVTGSGAADEAAGQENPDERTEGGDEETALR